MTLDINIRSVTSYNSKKYSLSLFKELYCEKESPKFTDKKFWNLKTVKFNQKNKILFISGGSRNGNHLVTSLLDSVDEIPFYPGEDKLLTKIFNLSKSNHERLIKNLNQNPKKILLGMSGYYYNKWKKIYLLNILKKTKFNSKKYWAGRHPNRFVAMPEHYGHLHKVDYKKFQKKLEYIVKKKSNFKDIFSLFYNYLEAYRLLVKPKKKILYQYTYACSGMRKEMNFFAKSKNKFKCVVPIRDFRSFYFSKIKGRYNVNKINNFYLNEAWDHWKHKTIDYLLLKKKYPEKFVLVRYEDLTSKKNKSRKLLNSLGIRKKYFMNATMHGVPVKGNSSFKGIKRKPGEIKDLSKSRLLPKKFIPKEYYDITKLIKKYSI